MGPVRPNGSTKPKSLRHTNLLLLLMTIATLTT